MLIYDTNEIHTTPYSKLSVFSYAAITHGHTFFEFTIVLDGSCNSIINDGPKKVLKQGDMIFLRPGDIHMLNPITQNYRHRDFYVTMDKMRRICNTFSDTFFEELLSPELELQYELDINEYSLLDQKATILNSSLEANTEKQLDQLHTSIICQLIGIIIKQRLTSYDTLPDWLSSLFLHLSSFHYVNYSINEIIETTGYSHSYVCRKFKDTYGITLLDYHNKCKVILSTNLLGKEKIIDIANSLGWENPKNYSIAFKKVFGITPRQYIATTKQHENIQNTSTQIVFPTPPTNQLSDLPVTEPETKP